MGQKSIYNSLHKHHCSLNETLGFNQDDHPYRMCSETGIPEFPGIANSRNSNGCDGDVTCTLPARSYPTRFYQRAHPTHIYMSYTFQILKNPPEYTMRYIVQPGRNTKNEAHAHLLGNALQFHEFHATPSQILTPYISQRVLVGPQLTVTQKYG